MQRYHSLKTSGNPRATLSALLGRMFTKGVIDALLVAAPSPHSPLPMPTLFADPGLLAEIDPLAPVAPFNSARQAVSVLRQATGKRVALVLRPCEMRALIELVKLNQADVEQAVLIGLECQGRMEPGRYLERLQRDGNQDSPLYRASELEALICETCQTCDQFQPRGADISILTIGLPLEREIGLWADSNKGEAIIAALEMPPGDEPAERAQRLEALRHKRRQAKTALFARTAVAISSIENCEKILANCLNCYNCRNACPVCYCKACVFINDAFEQAPEVLLRRAQKRGRIKLPPDTTMFHWTRLAHMSHACVGCGHCSSVCPSGIPVANIFRTVATQVQELYAYEPGRDPAEKVPLLDFESQATASSAEADNKPSGSR